MTDEGMNKLKDLRKEYELLAKYNGGEDYITFKALDMAVKELSHSEIPNKWIPVSERLPEKRGCYIVTEKVFRVDDRNHKGRFNIITELVEWSGEKWQRAVIYEIIAWMPIPNPEPYGVEKGGE